MQKVDVFKRLSEEKIINEGTPDQSAKELVLEEEKEGGGLANCSIKLGLKYNCKNTATAKSIKREGTNNKVDVNIFCQR